MLFLEKPADFHPQFDAVGCFIIYRGKILFLLRQPHKPQGNTWGIPGGKVELRENLQTAIIREVREETGIVITNIADPCQKVYVIYPNLHFIYHVFIHEVINEPQITLEAKSHAASRWLTPREALAQTVPLIEDLDINIQMLLQQFPDLDTKKE